MTSGPFHDHLDIDPDIHDKPGADLDAAAVDTSPDPAGLAAPTAHGPQPENRSKKPWIIALVVVLAAGAAGLWLGTRQRQAPGEDADIATTSSQAPDTASDVPPAELVPGDLYFPGADGRLYPERRDLPAGTPQERAQVLVEALLLGPAEGAASGLRAPLPPGTRIETVYLMGTTAVLDLRPPEPAVSGTEGPPTPAEVRLRRLSYGSKQELLALYSLVNTVVLGVEGVETVQILWDGRQPETFAGHVDTTRPVAANPRYVASR